MSRYKPTSAEEEGLENHLERLGFNYKLWRRLVGDNPEQPIANVTRIMRGMGVKSRSTIYRWLKIDAKDKQTTTDRPD